jgi:SAM-dependent methyltransferase
MAQDAGRPEFWEERYRNGVTPWDAGGAPAAFCAWLAKERAPLSVLVPGCGSGYEVRALAEQGHDVLAIDFSEAAVEAARRQAHGLRARIRHEDFFQLSEPPVEVLYERTFMCALPPRMRAAWAERVQALVRPGGRLLGFFFFDAQPKGPPFGIAPSALHALLDPGFALLVDEPVPAAQSVPVLAGKERWQVWQRRL